MRAACAAPLCEDAGVQECGVEQSTLGPSAPPSSRCRASSSTLVMTRLDVTRDPAATASCQFAARSRLQPAMCLQAIEVRGRPGPTGRRQRTAPGWQGPSSSTLAADRQMKAKTRPATGALLTSAILPAQPPAGSRVGFQVRPRAPKMLTPHSFGHRVSIPSRRQRSARRAETGGTRPPANGPHLLRFQRILRSQAWR